MRVGGRELNASRRAARPLLSVAVAAALVLSGCTWGVSDNTAPAQAEPDQVAGSVLDMWEEWPAAFHTFIWQLPESGKVDERFRTGLQERHPLMAISSTFGSWLTDQDEAVVTRRLDRIIDTWDLESDGTRASYGFPYKVGDEELPAGWYSGMADWTLPLLLTSVWQETGEERYHAIAQRLVEQASRSIDDGGTLWFEGDACWISEYAWEGMQQEQESFVMNGHQFALTGMGLLAATTGDERLAELFAQCSEGIFERSTLFHKEGVWPLYMLNPESIDTRAYSIFEILTFDGLAIIAADNRFDDEAQWRRTAFRDTHPVTLIQSSAASAPELTFSLLGPPHPYEFDMFRVEVQCSDGQSEVNFEASNARDSSRPVRDRGFARVRASEFVPERTTCSVGVSKGPVSVHLFEAPAVDAREASVPTPIPSRITSLNTRDARGSTLLLEPPAANTSDDYLAQQSRITFTADTAFEASSQSIFGVSLGSDQAMPVSVLVSSGDRTCHRYYPPIKEHRTNAILVSVLGLPGCEDLTSVDAVTVIFYRSELSGPVTIKPGHLHTFNDAAALTLWIEKMKPFVPHQ